MSKVCTPAVAILAAAVSFGCAGDAGAVQLELVNRTSIASPLDSNNYSNTTAGVSSDGRYAVFYSDADNLVAGDSNGLGDLFLYDHQDGSVERVNVGHNGAQATAETDLQADVSDDGRYVVFRSRANLVPQNTHDQYQIYLRDRVAGTTTLLSAGIGGVAAAGGADKPRISGDGRYVLFVSDAQLGVDATNGFLTVYRLDRQSGQLDVVSQTTDGRAANSNSFEAQMSEDGRFVVFSTFASNLLPGDLVNSLDIALRDMSSGAYTLVSATPAGSDTGWRTLPKGNAISADGRYVLFETDAALDPQDDNSRVDAFRFDRQDGSITRVSLGAASLTLSDGADASSISADGNLLLMETRSPNALMPAQPYGNPRSYTRNLTTGEVHSVGLRNGAEQYFDTTWFCHMAGAAPVVFCDSGNDGLADADSNEFSDVFRRDLAQAQTRRVSTPPPGPTLAYANGHTGAYGANVSADGRFVVFESRASNLVVGDNNGVRDVFLRDRLLGTTLRVSGGNDALACESNWPDITPDGRYIVFQSCAALTQPSVFGMHIYRYDRISGEMLLVSRASGGGAADGYSEMPRLSDDGNVVIFHSYASNLVTGTPAGYRLLYVRDIAAASTAWVNRPLQGVPGDIYYVSDISGDGSQVLFTATSDQLVPGDDNGVPDVFAFDRVTHQLERVSVSTGGGQLSAGSALCGVSDDASVVAYASWSSEPPCQSAGIVLHDRGTGEAVCVGRQWRGQELMTGYTCSLSADGQRVAFAATYFGGNRYKDSLFLWRRPDASVQQLTRPRPNANLGWPQACAGGDCLVFYSRDTGLVAEDGNGAFGDVFLVRGIDDMLFADGFEAAD